MQHSELNVDKALHLLLIRGFTQPATEMSTGRFLAVKIDRRVRLTN
jgi:hypothetical protein